MPNMDGITATANYRAYEAAVPPPEGNEGKQKRRLPIVALTGHVVSSEVERCRSGGMDHFLRKPLSLPELVAVLDSIMAAKRT
jgi:CheY-like chemotaxis protein